MQSRQTIGDGGIVEYHNENNQLHRLDGPARIYPNGMEYWYKEGQQHRDDGPAVTFPDGQKFWYNEGVLFGDNKPAKNNQYNTLTKEQLEIMNPGVNFYRKNENLREFTYNEVETYYNYKTDRFYNIDNGNKIFIEVNLQPVFKLSDPIERPELDINWDMVNQVRDSIMAAEKLDKINKLKGQK